jgi:NADH:ubiquinone oxidoreductase subunit E
LNLKDRVKCRVSYLNPTYDRLFSNVKKVKLNTWRIKMNTQAPPIDHETLMRIIENHDAGKWDLIPLLQAIQEEFGYIPPEAIMPVADHLKVFPSEVQGVIEFYAGFGMKPKGRHIFKVCCGTACHVKGSRSILSSITKELGISEGETSPDYSCSLETVACLGACFLAPTLMADKEYYGRLTPSRIGSIVNHVKGTTEGEKP